MQDPPISAGCCLSPCDMLATSSAASCAEPPALLAPSSDPPFPPALPLPAAPGAAAPSSGGGISTSMGPPAAIPLSFRPSMPGRWTSGMVDGIIWRLPGRGEPGPLPGRSEATPLSRRCMGLSGGPPAPSSRIESRAGAPSAPWWRATLPWAVNGVGKRWGAQGGALRRVKSVSECMNASPFAVWRVIRGCRIESNRENGCKCLFKLLLMSTGSAD